MAASHVSKRYGVKDAKVYPVTADTDAAYTYGSGIDVPGIKSVTLDATTATKELRGDNRQLDSLIQLTGISGTINFAKDSLDVTAAALGLTVVDATNTATLTITGDSSPAPLRFEALAAASDFVAGDVKLVLPKITMIPLAGLAEEDYETLSVSFTAAALVNGNHDWLQVVHSDIAMTLSA